MLRPQSTNWRLALSAVGLSVATLLAASQPDDGPQTRGDVQAAERLPEAQAIASSLAIQEAPKAALAVPEPEFYPGRSGHLRASIVSVGYYKNREK